MNEKLIPLAFGLGLAYVGTRLLRAPSGVGIKLVKGANWMRYLGPPSVLTIRVSVKELLSPETPEEEVVLAAIWYWDRVIQDWRGWEPDAPDWANSLWEVREGQEYVLFMSGTVWWDTEIWERAPVPKL